MILTTSVGLQSKIYLTVLLMLDLFVSKMVTNMAIMSWKELPLPGCIQMLSNVHT